MYHYVTFRNIMYIPEYDTCITMLFVVIYYTDVKIKILKD